MTKSILEPSPSSGERPDLRLLPKGKEPMCARDGYPTIGDVVYIGPGAKVFGKITIGSHVKIGANAVVHRDIPAGSVVALSPGHTVLS